MVEICRDKARPRRKEKILSAINELIDKKSGDKEYLDFLVVTVFAASISTTN